ncbi:unnamed protein product [Urochloa decumbens]|uniref:Protein kinase domain-containing protein n=1 Tax=Urochloa decumbens TaxID=240449 RepID=A0ABC9B0R6_9POAL
MKMKYLTAKPQLLQLLCLLLSPALVLSGRMLESASAPTPAAVPGAMGGLRPGCPPQSMCGDITIPYPFSIIQGCSLNESFMISCNHSYNPPRPFYREYEVNNITPETGEMNVSAPVAHVCYNSSRTTANTEPRTYNFTGTPFLISPEKNEFTGIGCYTLALLGDWNGDDDDDNYLSGCVTTCLGLDKAAKDGENCTGQGCCQTPTLPRDLDILKVVLSSGGAKPVNPAWKYSRCSYGFVAAKTWYKFKRGDLNGTGDMAPGKRVPLVLDWAIPDSKVGACASNHSHPEPVREGRQWYICKCSNGYRGNPYIDGAGGCKYVQKCKLGKSNCGSDRDCVDIDGTYRCKCKVGRSGPDCHPIFSAKEAAVLATFAARLLLALLVWFAWNVHKEADRRDIFDKNGGEILKHMNINIFTESQLENITNHYDTPIGRGAFGKVYRGTTHENLRVAVKRSVVEGTKPSKDHDMVNEIATLFEIRHANLVRLIGCCLETEVPMLVLEYVSNGSLYSVLHCGSTPRVLPLSVRLDIAIGSAQALAYMHSHGGHSLVHGDVKTGNILLGDNLTPKVSDFGSSKLESIARHGNFCVMGDLSYIDPVYKETGHFTQKSDVYSFGVVLLELITRKTPRYGNNTSLTVEFMKSCKEEGNGRKMYDRDIILSDGEAQSHRYVECLDQIGMLAIRCLKEDKDERPSMEEVVEELMQVKLKARGDTSCKTS